MKLPRELTTVTPLSKSLAIVLFVALPIVGFFLGMQYQKTMNPANKDEDSSIVACTQDAKLCSDGSYVGRQGHNCEFAACPNEAPDETANWKTYNGKFFSFNYPASWEIKPAQVDNPLYYGEGALFIACSTSILGASAFDISKYPSSYPTLDSYLKNNPQSGASSSTGKTIILGDEQAKYWEDSGDQGSSNPSARAVLFSKSRGLIIDLYFHDYCGKNLQQTSTEFNQILATFKFTE